jgi:hypothetical protein
VDAVADFTGTAADDIFVASATVGATAATTVNSGDAIDGGAGNDTLTITATSANNNSLTGLTATSIETVNIVGGNNLGASSPAFAAAQDAKALTAAALTSARAAVTLADGQSAAAAAVEVAVDALGSVTETSNVENALSNSTGVIETAVVLASTATAASASALDAAARYFDAQILVKTQELAAADYVASLTTTLAAEVAKNLTARNTSHAALTTPGFTAAQYDAALTGAGPVGAITEATADSAAAAAATALVNAVKGLALSTNTISDTITTFTAADVRTVATQSQIAADGTAITTAPAILARNAVLDGAYKAVNTLAASTGSTKLEAAQLLAAADQIEGMDDADITTLAGLGTTALGTAFTALNTTAYTAAQYQAAAKAALVGYDGVAVTGNAIEARSVELKTLATAVNGVAGDFSIAQLNAAAANALVNANGATIRTAADDSAAIETRTDALVPIAGTAASDAATAAATALANDTAAANAVTVALANVTATSIAASQFADATAITLSGSSSKANVTAVAATQTIGFSSVSSMENAVTFGATVATGSLAVSASTGALTVTGAAMTALNVSGTGTGTTGIALTDGGQAVSATGADTIKALNLSTSGATVINTTGMTALTSVAQTGAGGVTVNSTIADGTNADKLATVTTGAGADSVRITTATAADNLGTTIDETVNASVSTGAGVDRIVVATSSSGTGKTTVDAGAGSDTIILSSIGTGANSLSGGADNDTFRIEGLSTIATTTISGGDGTDVLRTTQAGTFTATHYTTLVANVSSIETLQLASGANVVELDASKVAVNRIEFLGSTTNTVTEVSSSQALAAVRTPVSASSFGLSAVTAGVVVTNITASAKDYDANGNTANGNVKIFGDNLNIAMTHVAADATVVANGNALTLSVTALGDLSSAVSGASVTGISSKAILSGDVKSVAATLTSARGVGSVDAPSALGEEEVAQLTIVLDSNGEDTSGTRTLGSLETITVSGAGVVTIDARTDLSTALDATAATLKTINLSGMTAFADLNAIGQEIGVIGSDQNAAGAYRNKSTSSVTLDNNVVETVVLGGAKDTVVTGSVYAKADTVSGFQLVASATDPLVADASRSDVLKIGASASTQLDATNSVKITVTGSTIEAALLQAASATNAAGTARENVVFNFGGDTYFFKDVGGNGLGDDDILVKMSGTLNLDLLLTSGVIIV